jgi:hypothetical protein
VSDPTREVLVTEEHHCPESVVGICSLIRNILESPGKVERFTFEVDQPVRVYRWVEKNDLMEEEEDSLGVILTRREMAEHLPMDGESPFETIFLMLHRLRMNKLHPVCWVTGPGSSRTLERWLKMNSPIKDSRFNLHELLGLKIERPESIPEETLLLCGSSFERAPVREINYSIKTAIDLRRLGYAEQVSRNDDPRGVDPQERSAATRALEGTRGRNVGASWDASRFLGSGLRRVQGVDRKASTTDGTGQSGDQGD